MSVFASYDEKLSEKFSLVYDYNVSSPLFVHKAAAEMEKNNIDQAIDILSRGLKQFPYYPTGYIFLARALALQTHYDEAVENLRRAAYLCGNEDLVPHYKKEIETIKKRRSPFEINKKNTFIENPDAAFLEEEPETIPVQEPTRQVAPVIQDEPDIAALARKIEGAKLPPLPVPVPGESTPEVSAETEQGFDANIVSETLAKIYFAQGKLTEALSLYDQLVKKEPHNRGRYKQAILEIKSLLSEQKKG